MTHRWKPGDPIPKRGEGLEPDAWSALCRHAEAAEAKPVQQPRRLTMVNPQLPPVAPNVRADYARELAALSVKYQTEGQPKAEADWLALDDLGCVEFYDFMRQRGRGAKKAA